MLSIEDNFIYNWATIDQLNEFPQIRSLRIGGNDVWTATKERARDLVIARCQFLTTLNGTHFTDSERRESELYYLQFALKDFLTESNQKSISDIHDE
jgi:hypothetical protein